jgi:hypothetical protein
MQLDWHFNFWLMFMFSVLSLLSGFIFTPETVTGFDLTHYLRLTIHYQYAPVLLRRRAAKLAQQSTGIHYISIHDCDLPKSISQAVFANFSRPFGEFTLYPAPALQLTLFVAVFLVTEPIVLCVALYLSIVYGTLYAFFAVFPIVFEQHRHFTSAQGGLAFIGIGVGIVVGLASTPIQNRLYWRAMEKSESGRAAPEA